MDYENLGNMGTVYTGPSSAGIHAPFYFPPSIVYYSDTYKDVSAPSSTSVFNSQTEIGWLQTRLTLLEDQVSHLMTLFFSPKDPEGSSGAPAAPMPLLYDALPPVQQQEAQDIALDTLILAQRQHHQQSPLGSPLRTSA